LGRSFSVNSLIRSSKEISCTVVGAITVLTGCLVAKTSRLIHHRDMCSKSVSWHHFRSMFHKKTTPQRAALSRYIHGWNPTSAFLRQQSREAPGCPFCGTTIDNKDHVLQCPDETALKFRTTEWNKCTAYLLDQGKGCPAAIDIIDKHIRRFLGIPPRTRARGIGRPRAAVQRSLAVAEAAQSQIRMESVPSRFRCY